MNNINMEILDRVLNIQQRHGTAHQLLSILANQYFYGEPDGRGNKLIFANNYKDMDELINAILEYSNATRDSLNELYCIAETNVKGD